MNILDKVYNLTVDIKNIDTKYNSYAKFFDDDRETSVIKVKILNNNSPINLENCSVEAYFVLANNTYHNETCKIINSSEGIVELQLCQKCLVKGENIVRLSILKDNEIANTPIITYEVRKGLYSDNPNFNDDPLTPILSQMLLDVKVTKVNQIELQKRYETSLPKIEGKIKEAEDTINRVNDAIASGTHDLEVKEARVNKDGKTYNKLKDRLDGTDTEISEVISNVDIENWYYPKNIKGTVLGTDNIPSSYNQDNYELFYDWVLNPLADEFSEYVTKTTLGKDTSDLYNIYRYDFTPENYDRTVVILSNVHGNEYTSFYGICRFLDDLCRNYKNDSNLSFLRRKVKLVVLPIVNPWGFVNSNRRNVNEVDLNRNANYRWEEYTSTQGQVGGKYYKGTEPFSEKESQYVKKVVEEVCNDKFVGFIDLHTLNTIEVEKVLYYPRFSENIVSKFANLMSNFNSETSEDRSILSSSAVPTFSNWVAHTYKVNACNPEFSNSAYGTTRDDFLMRKHVEWIGNILLTVAKENRKSKTTRNGPFSHMLMWDRNQETSEIEDNNRNSNKGHRVLKSDNYNTFNLTRKYINIPQEGILSINGNVRVYAEKDCTLYLDPLVYQQNSPEQNYSTLSAEGRYSEVVRLKEGQEVYVPINAMLQGFHTNYNDESSSRSGQVYFRLRAKADIYNAVWITGYKVILNFVPSDLGKCVTIERANYSEYETVYPLRIMEDIED